MVQPRLALFATCECLLYISFAFRFSRDCIEGVNLGLVSWCFLPHQLEVNGVEQPWSRSGC